MSETKWFKRLERCIEAMPESVEIAVVDGSISLLPVGAVNRAFKRDGHNDNFGDEAFGMIMHSRIITCSESL